MIGSRSPGTESRRPFWCPWTIFGPLAGCHGARRGTYRIAYRIDEQAHVVEVLDIDRRADIYHRSLTPLAFGIQNER
jgi:mRNA interferase RelE/StbE